MVKPITLTELTEKKIGLEIEIKNLLSKFEDDTGLIINSVTLNKSWDAKETGKVQGVEVLIKL